MGGGAVVVGAIIGCQQEVEAASFQVRKEGFNGEAESIVIFGSGSGLEIGGKEPMFLFSFIPDQQNVEWPILLFWVKRTSLRKASSPATRGNCCRASRITKVMQFSANISGGIRSTICLQGYRVYASEAFPLQPNNSPVQLTA